MTGGPERPDVEARLRASLRAYADVVDESPARRSPLAGGPSGGAPSPARGWRVPVLVAAAVLAVAGGTWFVTGTTGTPSPTAAPAEEATVLGGDARAESAPESATGSSPDSSAGAAAAGPAGRLVVVPPVEVGVAYPFDLYTHCGISGADVGGVWFAADQPLVQGSNGPPAGWDDPYQRGTLTLESTEVAVFRDDAGHEVRLRAAESERPPPCD